MAKHVFQGLRRRLYTDDAKDADACKLIYTRKPSFDVVVERGATPGAPKVIKVAAPRGKVFAVIVSPNNKHRDLYPTIAGWLDRWNWLPEDTGLAEAPVSWLDRYDKKLYSRS